MANPHPVVPRPLEDFLADVVAMLAEKLVTTPLDFMKLRLQCQGEMVRSKSLTTGYTGILNCFTRVLNEEGILAFYGGLSAQLARIPLTPVINGVTGPIVKTLFQINSRGQQPSVLYVKRLLSGTVSGALLLLVAMPLDFARTRLACDPSHQYSSVLDCISKCIRSEGISAMYRTFWLSVFGIFAYRVSYFGLYDTLRQLRRRNPSWLDNFALGISVTIASGLITYPLDTIRRRMMLAVGEPHSYNGAVDAYNSIVSNEGHSALFAGAFMNGVVRSVVSAGALVLTDKLKELYFQWRHPAPRPPPTPPTWEERGTQ